MLPQQITTTQIIELVHHWKADLSTTLFFYRNSEQETATKVISSEQTRGIGNGNGNGNENGNENGYGNASPPFSISRASLVSYLNLFC